MNIGTIGSNLIRGLRNTAGSLTLFFESAGKIIALKNAPVRTVLYKQVYFTGFEALSKIAIIGALIGVVIITQVANIVGFQAELTGKILVWTVVRELGPLFAAIIIIARSCTAMASELGAMKVNREVDNIKAMGIDPIAYLIVPRIAGVTLSVFILTFYFQLISVIVGLSISSVLMGIPFLQHLRGMLSAISLFEIGISLFKSLIFGMVISTVSCYHGMRVRSSITEIPQMTTLAVMQSLFLVIIINGIVTVVSFI